MADNDTLMAYLVPRLTGGVEDAATEALAYILNKSAGARRALDDLLRQDGFAIEPIARVRTQVSCEDGCIPDMAGYDQDGRTRLLVESKFWAAFGDGQVRQYARHLDQPGPAVLLIIGPEVRRQTLWTEAKRQMSEVGELEDIGSSMGANRARVNGTEPGDSQLHLMIVSWIGLLDLVAAKAGDAAVLEDVRQLRGLVQRQDEEGFLPIHPADLGADQARRMVWYNQIVDDVVLARGVANDWMNTKGVSSGGGKDGYTRYFRFSGIDPAFGLGVSYSRWAKSDDIPLWMGAWDPTEINIEEIGGKLSVILQDNWIPIYLKTGVEYDAVLDDVAAQLKRIGEVVRESLG